MEMSSKRGPFNRSVRELNNKNNLASLKLRKELAGYDREKKFLLEHIDRNRVDTYSFLKQLQFCESNLVPAYKQLLEGIITRPSMCRRRTRIAHTAPSTTNSDDKSETDKSGEQKQQPFVPKFTKAQIQLLQTQPNIVSNNDRAEMFLNRLRERHIVEMEEDAEDNQEPELVMSRKISRLMSMAAEDPDFHTSEDRWARPRESGFHSLERLGSIVNRHRPSELNECSLPALPSVPEPVRTKEFRASVSSPQEEDCFGRPVKRRPLEMRVREFYDKLAILKKRQDERIADVPIWEKRRRWILLTRGLGAALAESDSESDDGMERSGYY